MATSSWTWTLVIRNSEREITITGGTTAPANATVHSIIPGIVEGAKRRYGTDFEPVSFHADKIA
ncbi:hypothetical protein AB0E62_34190 [Streptomyces sp. NPDC038707]|uniref:hypothetical protein n=1 Tax=Streptomyces sp. NPDC038707 TaxID=3154329 RepID=UPI0033DBE244